MVFVIFGPIFIKNNNILLLIIVMNIVIVTGWYLYGYCFITDIEKLLNGSTEKNDNETRSFITIIFEEFLPDIYKNHIHIFFSIIPLLSTIICCLTIYLTKQPIRLFFDKGRNAFQRE